MKQLSILFRGTLGFPFPVSGAFALCLLLLASNSSSGTGWPKASSTSPGNLKGLAVDNTTMGAPEEVSFLYSCATRKATAV